jgi:hypothetical protein
VTRISSRAELGWAAEESSADRAGGGASNADISTIAKISMHENSSNLFIIPSGVDNYNVLFFSLSISRRFSDAGQMLDPA